MDIGPFWIGLKTSKDYLSMLIGREESKYILLNLNYGEELRLVGIVRNQPNYVVFFANNEQILYNQYRVAGKVPVRWKNMWRNSIDLMQEPIWQRLNKN